MFFIMERRGRRDAGENVGRPDLPLSGAGRSAARIHLTFPRAGALPRPFLPPAEEGGSPGSPADPARLAGLPDRAGAAQLLATAGIMTKTMPGSRPLWTKYWTTSLRMRIPPPAPATLPSPTAGPRPARTSGVSASSPPYLVLGGQQHRPRRRLQPVPRTHPHLLRRPPGAAGTGWAGQQTADLAAPPWLDTTLVRPGRPSS